jgi:hypothetical protein
MKKRIPEKQAQQEVDPAKEKEIRLESMLAMCVGKLGELSILKQKPINHILNVRVGKNIYKVTALVEAEFVKEVQEIPKQQQPSAKEMVKYCQCQTPVIIVSNETKNEAGQQAVCCSKCRRQVLLPKEEQPNSNS